MADDQGHEAFFALRRRRKLLSGILSSVVFFRKVLEIPEEEKGGSIARCLLLKETIFPGINFSSRLNRGLDESFREFFCFFPPDLRIFCL